MGSRRRAKAIAVAILLVIAAAGVGGCGGRTRHVVIPVKARETGLLDAYDLLHRLGLRVTLARSIALSSLDGAGAALSPRAGSRVPVGSTVTLWPEHGPMGSPSVLKSHPHYRVPDFIGKSASGAVAWANAHDMSWAIPALPIVRSTFATRLLSAYRIVRQTPAAGATIGQGVMVGRGFEPTPLTLTVVATS